MTPDESIEAGLDEVKRSIAAIAASQTGIDPYAYLCLLADRNQIPPHVNTQLIVIPATWGKAN